MEAIKMLEKTVVEVGVDGVAVISINNPPLNLLSVDVMLSLNKSTEETLLRDDVKAIVVNGSNGKFSAGFDVTAFGGSKGKKAPNELGFMSIGFVTDVLEAARKPVVAAIEGPAFGGALEIALACHARIATSTSQLGLTELRYGILPGWGGTQRLPRLVGLSKSLEMILVSKPIDGKEARVISLVDAIVPADKLLEVARQWALDILECRRPWVVSLYKTDKLEPLGEAKAILKSARLKVKRENPNVIYPLVCIDVIEMGIVSDPRKALWKEAEALEELRGSSVSKSLIHMFFAQRQIQKIPGVSKINLSPRKINKVGVVGGGSMCSDIAAMLLLRNYQVILKGTDKKHLFDEISRIKKNLERHAMNGKATPERLEETLSLLEGVLDYNNFKDIDLVIEASSESLLLKQEIFSDLEKLCPPHCIFTSSSSRFSLESICQNWAAHVNFFCPSPAMPLMEIVHMKNTSPQVIVDLMEFGRKLKKTSVVHSHSTDHGINNMFVVYLYAALSVTEWGLDAFQVDEAVTRFGMSIGPFRMIDMVGIDVLSELCEISDESLPNISYKPRLLSILQQDNREGKLNVKGFYKYDNSGKALPDPEMHEYLEKAKSLPDVTGHFKSMRLPENEIVEMILFPVVNEACRIISEGILVHSSDLDVASVLGMGFPNYRGGILYWADSLGSKYVCSRLENWSNEYGDLFQPCNYIVERASNGMSLMNPLKQVQSQL